MSRDAVLNLFYIFLSALAAFAADIVLQSVKNWVLVADQPLGWRIAVAYTIAFSAFFAILVIGRLCVSARPIRWLIAPEARLEGVWAQTTSRVERPRSIVRIRFDWLRYRWIYEGWAVPETRDAISPAEWRTENFTHRGGKYYFDAEARVRLNNPDDPVRKANVVGVLKRRAASHADSLVGNAVDFDLPRGEEVFEIVEMKRIATDGATVARVDDDAGLRFDLINGAGAGEGEQG